MSFFKALFGRKDKPIVPIYSDAHCVVCDFNFEVYAEDGLDDGVDRIRCPECGRKAAVLV